MFETTNQGLGKQDLPNNTVQLRGSQVQAVPSAAPLPLRFSATVKGEKGTETCHGWARGSHKSSSQEK